MIGLRELAILAVVVLVLYGRSGVLKSRQFQTIWPWISPQRRTSRPARITAAATRFRATVDASQPRQARPASTGRRRNSSCCKATVCSGS